MNGVVGQLLPLAVGIAISPMPIIAVVLMLMSAHGRSRSLGFLIGWLVGIVVAVGLVSVLSGLIPSHGETEANPIKGVIHLALGLLLLVMAVRTWRRRPRPGHDPVMPKWMTAIDSMSLIAATGLGFGFAAIAPKNLLLAASAGTTIGTADLDAAHIVLAVVIFTAIAGASIAIPVLAALIAGDRLAGPLASVHSWLARENAVIMAVLLLVLGAVVVGKGISSF